MASSSASAYTRPLPNPPSHEASPALIQYHENDQLDPNGKTTTTTTTTNALHDPPIRGDDLPTTPTTTLFSDQNGTDDDRIKTCNACKLGLQQTLDSTFVTFGNYMYHRCAKCNNLVEHDTNLILLSDGLPVCQNCSYICSACQQAIDNEAVVTGDDSYHAECFRCRQCANRIEELVFAKTSVGIWCMACHNDRVAQSRKRAEAKKAKAAQRKDRELNGSVSGSKAFSSTSTSRGDTTSSRSRGDRDRERSERAHAAAAAAHSRTNSNGSPLPTSSSATNLSELGRRAASPRAQNFPPSAISRSGQFESSLPTSASVPSLSSLAARRPLSPPALGTSSSPPVSGMGGLQQDANSLKRPSNGTPMSLSPALSTSSSGLGGTSPTFSAYMIDRRESETGSTLQVMDKATKRRSGFYGAATIDERSGIVRDDENEEDPNEAIRLSSTKFVSPPSPLPKDKFDQRELHGSMSFYDPDTLLFLNHVGSAPPKSPIDPNAPSQATSQPLALSDETNHYRGPSNLSNASEAIEHLSPDLESTEKFHSSSRDVATPGGRSVARKIRESIRLSRDGENSSSGKAGGLDVELVEMLLAELDETKKEMQDWQTKYNTFRRASRSAFEGFSMAREEYDREVAARKEVELKLEALKTRFVDQAKRLATVDQESKTAEALKRQSQDLRSSVVASERQLASLRAEIELSTAQAVELDKTKSEIPATADPDQTLVQALNSRLEEVKNRHREEITRLVEERDELQREIESLQEVRSQLVEDLASLQARNESLEDKNSDASRQLESLKDQMSRMKIAPTTTTNGHQQASSSLSGGASRSPHSRPTASPIPGLGELEQMHRFAKPETIEQPTIKKFKWGKPKAVTTASIGAPQLHAPSDSIDSRKGSVMGLGVVNAAALATLGSKTPQIAGRSGSFSMDSNARPHAFQQTSILRPVRCDYCGDKMWGLNEVRCTGCGCYSHTKCATYLQTPCSHGHNSSSPSHASEDTTMTLLSQSSGMFGNSLIAQAGSEHRDIPLVVTKCIGAVEAIAMWQEGLYRKSGGMGQTKRITQLFESGQDFNLEDGNQFNDPAAITSCLKNYFRCLPDPLFTFDLHEEFVSCTEMPEGESKLEQIESTLKRLPEAHYKTAQYLIRHLHRVHLQSAENKMTPANLGVVFGPTVMRSRIAEREWSDMGAKAKMIELLIENTPRIFGVEN